MKSSRRIRRTVALAVVLVGITINLGLHPSFYETKTTTNPGLAQSSVSGQATQALEKLAVKGRAPKTGYSRSQFGDGWAVQNGCDTRDIILYRDLAHTAVNASCQVVSGTLHDPYTGKIIEFRRGASSSLVQIDHVVPLSNAWQTGAQGLSLPVRESFANDPLELLAVDGAANQQKSDGDAATWLPPNKPFRCQYVSRQIAIKAKYGLWVTAPEKDAMKRVLSGCPGQPLPLT